MHFLEHFYEKTLKYELSNKFFYNRTKQLPKLKKIILNFGCKTTEIKQLASSLLALELIANQKGVITTTKRSNIMLKIRKGNPAGCKVTLKKNQMYKFLFKMISEIFPKLKNFNGFTLKPIIRKNTFSCELGDTFTFSELEKNYYLFNHLSGLNVTIITDSKKPEELLFLLKSLQFSLNS